MKNTGYEEAKIRRGRIKEEQPDLQIQILIQIELGENWINGI